MGAKRLEEKKNLERLEYILDGAGLGSWDWWLETNDVTFDRRWCEMLGLRFEQTPQTLSTWDLRVHPEDKDKAYEDIKAYLAGETEVYENIHRMRHAEGHWVWILDRGRISERDNDGRPIRFTGTHLDITKYREIENLSENIQRMASIGGWKVHRNGQMFVTSETARILNVNDRKVSWEVMQKTFSPKDVERAYRIFDIKSAREPLHGIFEINDLGGARKWVAISTDPLFNALGDCVELRGTIQDVTESQIQMRELEESGIREKSYIAQIESTKKHLEKLIETVPAGIFTTDSQGQCTFVNKTWTTFSGISAEKASGSGWAAAIHPEDREKVSRAWQNFVHDHDSFDLVYRFRKPDRTETIVHGRAEKIRGNSGNIEGYLGSLQDITEQVKIRQELQRAARELDNFFSLSIDLLCIADTNGWFLRVNPAWTKVLGYSEEELLSKPFIESIHPEDIQPTIREISRIKQMQVTASFENRYRSKDGNWHVLSWVVTPEPQSGLLYAVAHDVTSARLREAELEEAQRVAKIGSWSFDALSGEIRWSKQMFQLFPEDPRSGAPGYDRHKSTIHEDDADTWSDAVEKCLKDGIPYSIRFRSVFPDSKTVWVEAHGEGVFEDGRIIGLRGTCRDITDLVHAEEQAKIERAKAMQNSKLASLGEMSAGIAHEINNPLTVITGISWALEKYVGQPEKMREKIALIENAADRIERIVGGSSQVLTQFNIPKHSEPQPQQNH